MSKRANPTLVGSFIVIGVVLALGCIIVFGSLRWFSPMNTFVIYFEQTTEGLDQGSAVKFMGVTIGRVKDVLIRFNQADGDNVMPVLIEIDDRLLRSKIDVPFDLAHPKQLDRAVRKGLRARLEFESFVTARLYVSLAIDKTAGPPSFHQLRPIYPEIPSQLTELAQLTRSITQVNIAGIAQKIEGLLDRLDQTLTNLNPQRFMETTMSAVKRVEQLAASPEITNALVSIRLAADQLRTLTARLEPQVGPLAEKGQRALDEATATLSEARRAAAELRNLLDSRSTVRAELDLVLGNLANAAESVSALAEFLRRNPQALLSGRERAP